MAFDLANFKGDKIEVIVNAGGKELPFNINNFIEAHKVKNVRIYLRSQKVFDYSSEDESLLADMLFDNVHVVKKNTSSLIGSIEEREALKLEQDEAFNASLNADKKKGSARKLQHAREARVIPEPETNFVLIKVRHLTMGLCARRSPSDAKMSAVYDWAWSLSAGVIVLANNEVSDRCAMSMIKSSHTPVMSDSDDEVHFQGFGDIANCSAETHHV